MKGYYSNYKDSLQNEKKNIFTTQFESIDMLLFVLMNQLKKQLFKLRF
jgi:hypothetical protein